MEYLICTVLACSTIYFVGMSGWSSHFICLGGDVLLSVKKVFSGLENKITASSLRL